MRRQSWRDGPASQAPRRGLRPRIAAHNPWARIEAIARNHESVAAYREARARWLAGAAALFPICTYWLRRFASAPIVS